MPEFKAGDLINEKYEVLGLLGEGGMGSVYKAKELDLERVVAIKVPKDQFLHNEDFMARFRREAKLVARLNHDNIVQLYEYFTSENLVFMALEFVEGMELGDYVQNPPDNLTVGGVVEILSAACDALTYAHNHKVVHRDIKPANILVAPISATRHRVKVMDFGIAHIEQGELFQQQFTQLTAAGASMGTPSYMSPEQVQGQTVTAQSDIYSLACVFYYCFTLRLLFEGSLFTVISQHVNTEPVPPNVYNPLLPESLVPVILKGLAKNPANRYNTAQEMARALEEAMRPVAQLPFKQLLPEHAGEATMAIPIVSASTGAGMRFAPGHQETGAHPISAPHQTTPGQTPFPQYGANQATVANPGMTGAAASPYGQTVYAPQHAAPAAAASSKWLLVVILLLVLGGGVAWVVVSNSGRAVAEFRGALNGRNYAQAAQLASALQGEEAAAAAQELRRAAQAAASEAIDAFTNNDANDVARRVDAAEALLRDIAPAQVQGLETQRDALKNLRSGVDALRTYKTKYDFAFAQRDLRAEDIEELAGYVAEMERVSGMSLPSSYFDTERQKVDTLRNKVSTRAGATPTPSVGAAETPSTASREQREFERLEKQGADGATSPADMLENWRQFAKRNETHEPAAVREKIKEWAKKKAWQPEMAAVSRQLRFTMGANRAADADASLDEQPPHPVNLSPYDIGKHEVTAESFALFLNEWANKAPSEDAVEKKANGQKFMIKSTEDGMNTVRYTNAGWEAYPGYENYPANCVTWHGAKAYTQWLSINSGVTYDLPTEAQWERAAVGERGNYRYPWGNDIDQFKATWGKEWPSGGTRPKFADVLQPVDGNPTGASTEGALNLAGNVAEWVNDTYAAYPDTNLTDPTGPADAPGVKSDKIVRGGSWYSADPSRLRAKTRDRFDPSGGSATMEELGFRVARKAQ